MNNDVNTQKETAVSIDCDMAMDLVSLYNDGSASETSVCAIKKHLKNCDECRKFYKQYRIVTNRRSSYSDTAPTDQERIYNTVAAKLRRRRLFIAAALAFYSCAIAAVLTWQLIKQHKR